MTLRLTMTGCVATAAVAIMAGPAHAQAPAPAAAAASPAPSSAAGNWIAELPTAAAVRKVVHGADAADTTAQLDAALVLLCLYANIRNGHNIKEAEPGTSPLLAQRYREYSLARSNVDPKHPLVSPLPAASAPYLASTDFRIQVLSRLLSPASVTYYRNTEHFRDALQKERLGTQIAAARQQESQARQALLSSLAADRATAHGAKPPVETSAFGIELGLPLNVPPCPGGQSAPLTTCMSDDHTVGADPLISMAQTIAGRMTELSSTPGEREPDLGVPVTTSFITLAAKDRPEWLMAAQIRVLRIQDQLVAMAIGPIPGRLDGVVEKKLTDKYHLAPTTVATMACTNGYGVEVGTYAFRQWSMPGLLVSFEPGRGPLDCGSGTIRIETLTFRRLREAARAKREAAEPKL